jgi:hypothetical protein
MTALTAQARTASRPGPGQVSWRKLAWVTWRRQRAIVLAALSVIAGTALILVLSGLAIHHTAARLGPGWWIQRPTGYYSWVQSLPLVLQVMPILIGAFVGAPLLAREAEAGTFRFAWTQSAGRFRLLTAQLVPVIVILTAAAAGFGALFDWWLGPLTTGGVPTTRWADSSVDLFAPSLAGWLLASLTLGVLCGAVIRRTVAAMGATMAGYVVLAYLTATRWRDHYLAPLTGPAAWYSNGTYGRHVVALGTADQLTTYYAWPDGRRLTIQQMNHGARWYDQHHIAVMAVYQPGSRIWPLQWIEFGWLAALSLLLAAATVLIIRRHAA